jgi:hypothetical protein
MAKKKKPANPLASAPRVRERTLADYGNDPRNANKGTLRGQTLVETSMRRFGAGRSALADKKGRMIAGNKTLRAARQAGITKVIEVETDGDALIIHRRSDLDLDDPTAKALAVADNQTSNVGLEWDAAELAAQQAEGVPIGDFFTPTEWDALQKSEAVRSDAAENATAIPEMELQPFEEYDYIMLLFTNTQDLARAHEVFKITTVKVTMGEGKKAYVKTGVGRVIDGAKALRLLLGEK